MTEAASVQVPGVKYAAHLSGFPEVLPQAHFYFSPVREYPLGYGRTDYLLSPAISFVINRRFRPPNPPLTG